MIKRRTEYVAVRLSENERDALQRVADADGRTVSEWLREMIRREAEAQGYWPVEEELVAT